MEFQPGVITLSDIAGGTLAGGTIGAGVTFTAVPWSAVLSEESGGISQSVLVPFTGVWTQVDTRAWPALTAGQVLLMTMRVHLVKGGIGGYSGFRIRVSGGTGTLIFADNETVCQFIRHTQGGGIDWDFNFTIVWRCTAPGTPVLDMEVCTVGSTIQVNPGDCVYQCQVMH